MRTTLRVVLVFVSTLPVATRTVVAAPILVNGGFETGNFAGWTAMPGPGISFFGVNNADPHTGRMRPISAASFQVPCMIESRRTSPRRSTNHIFSASGWRGM